MNNEIMSKVCEIIKTAMSFNDTPTNRKITGDKPTIFCDFAGNVNTFDVWIHGKGWEYTEPYCHADEHFIVELDKSDTIEQLNKISEYLKAIIDEWKW